MISYFLVETLDSIFNQTFQDFEIVLVDGASTDDTIDILKSYKDPRLRWISEPDNDANEGFYRFLIGLIIPHLAVKNFSFFGWQKDQLFQN